MNKTTQIQVKAPPTKMKTNVLPVQNGLLQRKCACGDTPGVDGECAECRAKRLNSSSQTKPRILQTKLTVNQPGDRYEQEADRVAEQVMRMQEPDSSTTTVQSSKGEEQLHRQFSEESEEEETLQAKETQGQTPIVSPALQTRIDAIKRGGGQPLAEATRAFMEPRFGHDFSNVRIHADSQAAETARDVNARAYTVGRDIVFGTGQYTPSTKKGKTLLAHELTHVRQQVKHENSSASLMQRVPEEKQQNQCLFDTNNATRYTVTRGEYPGNYYHFLSGIARTNNTNRPLFQSSEIMIPYTGAGSKGKRLIHPIIASPLHALMSSLQEMGKCLDDESMKQAYVASAYRAPDIKEGEKYLEGLQKTLKKNPKIFGDLRFPKHLEDMAKSDLGFVGEEKHNRFVKALSQESGWENLAKTLVKITGNFKAPRGGSAHHSGLAVDINFPSLEDNTTTAKMHGIHRENNPQAMHSAAGIWLGKFAPSFQFSSYNTEKEIWHQEWLSWKGTSADPKHEQKAIMPQATEQQPVISKEAKQNEIISVGPGPKERSSKSQEITTSTPGSPHVATIPTISYAKNANAQDVTIYSRKVLVDILQKANLTDATISSTSRDSTNQARVMFDNLQKHGVKAQKALYGKPGQSVIDIYAKAKQEGKNDQEIKSEMKTKIDEIGPTNVSHHASDPHILNVFDVAPTSIKNPAVFERAVRDEGRVSKFLKPPKDPGYHLEIPQ